MENEYSEYVNSIDNELQKQYVSNMVRQQNLRNYFANSIHFGGIPAGLDVVLNYLYEKEIKTTKFNDIDLEQSIFDTVLINNL